MCVWRRLGVRHKRLGVVKGVRRRASPRRLKNNDGHTNLHIDIHAQTSMPSTSLTFTSMRL